MLPLPASAIPDGSLQHVACAPKITQPGCHDTGQSGHSPTATTVRVTERWDGNPGLTYVAEVSDFRVP